MIRKKTVAEQTAEHLLDGIKEGRWKAELPGVNLLSVELGVSREAIRRALEIVEKQGYLEKRGAGRARVIVPNPERGRLKRKMRVVILLHDRLDDESSNTLNLILEMRRRVEAAGHHCLFAKKTQSELKENPGRITRLVEQTPADAWVVMGGGLELLQWFAESDHPILAVGGRVKGLSIATASREVVPAYQEVFRNLIQMGHRRITLLSSRGRRLPVLSAIEKCMKEELEAQGIPFGGHNLPDWDETPIGLEKILTSLFQVTPPTVVQVSYPKVAAGVLVFLSRRGLRVPEDVSLICEHKGPTLDWLKPDIAHYSADFEIILRRVVRWVDGAGQGKPDRRRVVCPALFHPGASIAPPKERNSM